MSAFPSAKLTAIARALGHEASLFDEQGQATLRIEGTTLVLQGFEEAGVQVLVVAAELGTVAPEARARVYATMLAANVSWRDVGGGALALDESTHNALLMLRLDVTTLDDQALAQRLYAYTDAALNWAARLGLRRGAAAAVEAMAPASELTFAPGTFA